MSSAADSDPVEASYIIISDSESEDVSVEILEPPAPVVIDLGTPQEGGVVIGIDSSESMHEEDVAVQIEVVSRGDPDPDPESEPDAETELLIAGFGQPVTEEIDMRDVLGEQPVGQGLSVDPVVPVASEAPVEVIGTAAPSYIIGAEGRRETMHMGTPSHTSGPISVSVPTSLSLGPSPLLAPVSSAVGSSEGWIPTEVYQALYSDHQWLQARHREVLRSREAILGLLPAVVSTGISQTSTHMVMDTQTLFVHQLALSILAEIQAQIEQAPSGSSSQIDQITAARSVARLAARYRSRIRDMFGDGV